MTNPIIEVDGLHKAYGAVHAVRGVSFEVAEGEVFSLLGPNGAGKTTLLSMLCGLLEPTQGDARVAGHSIASAAREVKKVLGVVPQEVALYPNLSARENLRFWGRMYGLGKPRLGERVEAVLGVAGLAERAGERVETWSGGMKRRLNVAVALLHEPQILLLDEPTVGIDPQSRRRILDTVVELNTAGTTVLYTTHYMEEAAELSHRIGILDRGELIALGTLDELTRQVGHYHALHLDLAEDQDPGALVAALEALAGVHRVLRRDRRIVVQSEDAQSILPRVVTEAHRCEVAVQRFEVREPNLEAVFLHLTGRALRD